MLGCITCVQRNGLALLAGTVVIDSHNGDGIHLSAVEGALDDAGGACG